MKVSPYAGKSAEPAMLVNEAKKALDVALPPHAAAVTIEFTAERANRVNP
jgi:hypothetical protein